ncbi:MAG TPA: hypothetical protein V6D29_07895 [Leptolyngbyaceae cyanobacterium]
MKTVCDNKTTSKVASQQPVAPAVKVGAFLLLAVAGLGLPACSNATPQADEAVAPTEAYTPPEVPEREVAGAPVAVEDVNKGLDSYLGETVTVSGQVAEVHGPQAFTIGSDANLSPDKPVLVIVPNPKNMAMPQVGQYVQLIGEVQVLVPPTLEEKYNFQFNKETSDDIVTQYNMQPVVVAKDK